MKVRFKLFAGLRDYLPAGTDHMGVLLERSEAPSAHQLLAEYHVPREEAHLVLVNGVYIAEEDRDKPLIDGDVLAIWPPVAGG